MGALLFFGGEHMAALVSIGGFNFPEPSTYNTTTSTIVDSGHNVSRYVIGTVMG